MPGCLFVLFCFVDYHNFYYWASQSIPEYASVRYLVISISSIKVGRHTAYIYICIPYALACSIAAMNFVMLFFCFFLCCCCLISFLL